MKSDQQHGMGCPDRRRLVMAITCMFCLSATGLLADTASAQGNRVDASADYAVQAKAKASPTLSLIVPLRDSSFFLGEIDIEVAFDGSSLRVHALQLSQMYAGRITESAARQLTTLADEDGLIGPQEAAQSGILLTFDSAAVEVQATLGASSRSSTELSLGGPQSLFSTPRRTGREPDGISAYVTLSAFTTTAEDDRGNYSVANPSVGLDGAVHVAPLGNVTLESSFSVAEDGEYTRGSARAVLIDPDERWAVRAGEVSLNGIDFMDSTSILGIELTNSRRLETPLNSVRNVGENSFFLERPAVARLIINGLETQRFELDPGPYELSDFPLADGANDVVFIIEDDTGEVERIAFNVFADLSLLTPGAMVYGLSAGVPADDDNYDYDTAVASGFVQRGLTANLSSSLGAQASSSSESENRASLLAWGFQYSTRNVGRYDLRAATSYKSSETGHTARLTWTPGIRQPESNDAVRSRGSLTLSAQFEGRGFSSLFGSPAAESSWSFNGNWNQRINRRWSYGLGVSSRFSDAGDDSHVVSASTGFSHLLWSYSLLVAHRIDDVDDDEDNWSASLRLSHSIGQRGRLSMNLSAPETSASIEYSNSSERQGVGSWNYSVGLSGDSDNSRLNGGFEYTANRFALQASQRGNVQRVDDDSLNLRGSIRLGTAVAYADGQFAIGRPIQNSFLILNPHATLEDEPVTVISGAGQNRSITASSGVMGPALVPNLANTGSSTILYDVENLPLGYDLGSASVNLSPRYRSGFAHTVGSAFTVTVIGNLVNRFDEPLGVTPGIAQLLDSPDTLEIELFSNRVGRFGAQGLAPGRWLITMNTTPKSLTYILDVPEESVGLVRVGTLKPNEASK